MRPLALAVALLGIGALVLVAPAMRGKVRPADDVAAGSGPAVTETAAAREAAPATPIPSVVRPVAPEIVAPPPVEPRALERIEPRAPLGPMGRAHVPSEGPPKETVLHRPLVVQAGAFEAMGYRIVLAGLRPTPADETCIADGVSWPCGVHARTAFRNWLRGRALACVVPPAPPAETVVTPCRLGGFDAGEWLVAQGWAHADAADGRYGEQARAAREARRGLHGSAPAAAALPTVTVPKLSDSDLIGSGILDADPDDSAASGG